MLNQAVGKMVTAALWTSPLGIGSLIAASILRACDLLGGCVGASEVGAGVQRAATAIGACVCIRAWLREWDHACKGVRPVSRSGSHPLPCVYKPAVYPTCQAGTLSALGLWAATVVLGLALFALLLLPALLYFVTG